eukprot:NODE_5002_length_733_cov_16.853801_g4644_i0.p1 GENE.NODE_5002_length_733_cov_16.853801_g4644_i0~~NODE_5002_length_733_cov_16.853801_g4644_i0.p1  ORF type:complete len:126 (-),score=19.84 NODE_5002_length_733_cov_16.853801_g4644_i0:243-620(-)
MQLVRSALRWSAAPSVLSSMRRSFAAPSAGPAFLGGNHVIFSPEIFLNLQIAGSKNSISFVFRHRSGERFSPLFFTLKWFETAAFAAALESDETITIEREPQKTGDHKESLTLTKLALHNEGESG